MKHFSVPMTFVTTKDLIVQADNEADALVVAMGLNHKAEANEEPIDWDINPTQPVEILTDEDLLSLNTPWS